MKTRKKRLLVVALATLALMATACNKTDSSANANVASSPGKSINAPSSTSSAASNKRFVGTWTEEGEKNDKGTRFTEDGKVIEVSTEKQVGTYTATGNDKATITIGEGGSASATLESDTRMLMETGREKTYLIRK
jgi:ABC-type phosphate/phosphonate transport system substrate-binding protein